MKDIVAMILAGGQGSRLGVLTDEMAKPAVPFGSRYRIIDFTLSNCSNSEIDTVGILTQYQPLALNTYISNGHPWDLDRNSGGAFILPPYQKMKGTDWYTSTANAVYQNIGFIDNFKPKYVLILSGDHIYKMNYNKMLRSHIENKADATVAVIEVPWKEASRFGILLADENDRILDFEEKPKNPRSNLASMGIYIFTWDVLREKLIQDAQNPQSSHDFGHNIIPTMFEEGYKLQAYRFSGYWKDVGTISSLWEANMDILDYPEDINLMDSSWRIYGRNPVKPAHFVSSGAEIKNSCITDGCRIYGTVEHSVLSHSVHIEKGAIVKDSVLMPGVHVKKGARVEKCVLGMDVVVGENCILGGEEDKKHFFYNKKICSDNITLVKHNLEIKEGTHIPGNCMVYAPSDLAENDTVKERESV